MSMRTVLITPIDAWFFRDGRPYNVGEADQTDVSSLFPPFAPTIVGALRAALAADQGWGGRGYWAESLHPILGNGLDDLGQLQFRGPFLMRADQWLLPVPLHLLGIERDGGAEGQPTWSPSAFLTPNLTGPVLESDLGPVRFPILVKSKDRRGPFQEPAGMWITEAGYNRILRGEMPDAETVIPSAALWKTEPRVGLARNHETRGAEEGELYSPEYVRLEHGVALAVGVEGIPEAWMLPDLIAFGGESRMAQCENRPAALPLRQPPDDLIRQSSRFTISLLSPLCLPMHASGCLVQPKPGHSFPGLAASTIVSACVGKPIHIGGWNSLTHEPVRLSPCLPAGSTWFCEAGPTALDSILDLHGQHVGERTQYGFGQIALGAWPQETGGTP